MMEIVPLWQKTSPHFAYLKRLLWHKRLVLEEGRKLGIPVLQLLLHDWSKFLPDEWSAGVAFYQKGTGNDGALRKHYRRNRHHPQWWAREDTVQPMPEVFRLELLADWRAMSREKGGDVASWYAKHGHDFPLHPETRAWLEREIVERTTEKGQNRTSLRRSQVNYKAINLEQKFSLFSEPWQPKVIAEMNDYQFKLVRLLGDFVWHDHPETDETFLVIAGELRIDFEGEAVTLKAGEMFIVPRGVRHKPYAENEARVMLIEPKGILNTGHEGGEKTAENDVRI